MLHTWCMYEGLAETDEKLPFLLRRRVCMMARGETETPSTGLCCYSASSCLTYCCMIHPHCLWSSRSCSTFLFCRNSLVMKTLWWQSPGSCFFVRNCKFAKINKEQENTLQWILKKFSCRLCSTLFTLWRGKMQWKYCANTIYLPFPVVLNYQRR